MITPATRDWVVTKQHPIFRATITMSVSPGTDIPGRKKTLLVSVLIFVWLAGSLFGLWWFQQQSLRPFVEADAPAESRSPEIVERGLAALLKRVSAEYPDSSDALVTVVHLWNPNCLCNNVSARHTRAIIEQWPEGDEVRFIILAPETLPENRLAEARELNPNALVMKASANDRLPLTASPGLAVLNQNAGLAYFGAYGFGALCSLSDEALFTNMIERLLAGESYGPFMNIAGSGCFCAWPDSTQFTGE